MQGQESIEKPDRNNCNVAATADQKELQVYFAISAFSSISEFHAWHVWGTDSTDSSLTGGWENQVLFLCASLFLCVWIKLPTIPPQQKHLDFSQAHCSTYVGCRNKGLLWLCGLFVGCAQLCPYHPLRWWCRTWQAGTEYAPNKDLMVLYCLLSCDCQGEAKMLGTGSSAHCCGWAPAEFCWDHEWDLGNSTEISFIWLVKHKSHALPRRKII